MLTRRRRIIAAVVVCCFCWTRNTSAQEEGGPPPAAATTAIPTALTFDIPLYISNGGEDGFETAVLREALGPGKYEYRFVQMSYDDVQTAIARDVADVALAISIRPENRDAYDGVYFSYPFIAFTNFAITRSADNITTTDIKSIQDLDAYGPVYTWEGAVDELGEEFHQTFSSNTSNYSPIANQTEQVVLFWDTPNSIIVIDSSIFAHTSEDQLGYNVTTGATFHDLFPTTTGFRVGFRNESLRDEFSTGLRRICSNGRYAQLAVEYGMRYDPDIVCSAIPPPETNATSGGGSVYSVQKLADTLTTTAAAAAACWSFSIYAFLLAFTI